MIRPALSHHLMCISKGVNNHLIYILLILNSQKKKARYFCTLSLVHIPVRNICTPHVCVKFKWLTSEMDKYVFKKSLTKQNNNTDICVRKSRLMQKNILIAISRIRIVTVCSLIFICYFLFCINDNGKSCFLFTSTASTSMQLTFYICMNL